MYALIVSVFSPTDLLTEGGNAIRCRAALISVFKLHARMIVRPRPASNHEYSLAIIEMSFAAYCSTGPSAHCSDHGRMPTRKCTSSSPFDILQAQGLFSSVPKCFWVPGGARCLSSVKDESGSDDLESVVTPLRRIIMRCNNRSDQRIHG